LNRLSRVHECYRRQTDDRRQTDGRQHIANVNVSSPSLIKTKRIYYKFLSLTYKVLTTIQPSYLHNLISIQPPHSTRSSYSYLCYFRYASRCLCNQLPVSLRQPHPSLSRSGWPLSTPVTSDSSLWPSITTSLFHSRRVCGSVILLSYNGVCFSLFFVFFCFRLSHADVYR